MKYVRTEDGIFRIANDKITVINGCQFVLIRYGIFHGLDVKDKLADTIEELCDKYVYIRPNGFHESYDNLSDDDLDYIREGWIIYGAIWTDKGLIYVAKMNESGVLELL